MQCREAELILKAGLSSDWRLQLASMKLESLVIVDQHATVNTFPGLVHTARQATKERDGRSRRTKSVPTPELSIGTKS